MTPLTVIHKFYEHPRPPVETVSTPSRNRTYINGHTTTLKKHAASELITPNFPDHTKAIDGKVLPDKDTLDLLLMMLCVSPHNAHHIIFRKGMH